MEIRLAWRQEVVASARPPVCFYNKPAVGAVAALTNLYHMELTISSAAKSNSENKTI